MPQLRKRIILRAWRFGGEEGVIHYIVEQADGRLRHLITKEGDAMYSVLDGHLLAQGYVGPKVARQTSS